MAISVMSDYVTEQDPNYVTKQDPNYVTEQDTNYVTEQDPNFHITSVFVNEHFFFAR